ncbi:pyridoxamine 5'-phosphate oxidase [Thiopseudomonas denitrificans]|uniref:Pyridoxine/pyridoxamine 5'-phosphate oxidase n=1 Tax=Thiopseudomonas denitrificans TaxID=1501432 RepID=A0A4R6U130_9GAMM|nr:pyridoxamine 5'-phosphate oxidase [Thiopseudomonas denitrificans]TDQ40010.1 pyridoxamine 5'-phosphate oxidase [Thiopseudomonas denitrificans]
MHTAEQLAHMRRNYVRDGLLEGNSPANPMQLFGQWLEHAVQTEKPPSEANAMLLSTADASGQPHARIMLLKGMDERGFVFFSNYQSAKGLQMEDNPLAALTFFWPVLERQVRIEGRVERVSADESDAYYAVRPLGSRLGAWASPQSQPIGGREQLAERLAAVNQRFADNDNPARPPHWGGYRVLPQRIEFWQGRPDRLHDRLDYRLQPDSGDWSMTRLAP